MNDNIKIDSVKLNGYIEKLKADSDKMKEVFENIKKCSSKLPEFWETDTSLSTIDAFNKMYKEFDTINDSNQKYIAFLEGIVSSDYQKKETNIKNIIDSNI